MKLSQIKTVSWAISIVGIGASSFFAYNSAIKALALPDEYKMAKWQPKEGESIDIEKKRLLTEHALMSALGFLTKIDIPPPPEPIEIDTPPDTIEVDIPEVKPELKSEIALMMISFDPDRKRAPLAFLKLNERSTTHPYFEGEYIYKSSPRVKVKEINKGSVVIVNDQGNEKTLYLSTTIPGLTSSKSTTNSSSLSRSAIATVKKVEAVTAEPKDPAGEIKPSKTEEKGQRTRIVPRTRDVIRDESYGINIVEYDAGNNNEKRFAISETDKRTLENQKFRLMSEVNADVAYNNSGEPYGVKLSFLADDPLIKRYGVKDSDVITHVDGKPVTSVNQGLDYYDSLSPKKREVKVTIDRNGTKIITMLEMDDFSGVKPKK